MTKVFVDMAVVEMGLKNSRSLLDEICLELDVLEETLK